MTPDEKLVDEVLAAQRAKGRAKYGKGLDHTEPRDWNRMALEELADAVQYVVAENARLRESLVRILRHGVAVPPDLAAEVVAALKAAP